MVDTVTAWLDTNDTEKAVKALSDQRETIDRQTGEVSITGRLENFRLKITGQGLLITGSLGKFFLGDDARTLTRKMTARGIASA